jgi:hypothetical protein
MTRAFQASSRARLPVEDQRPPPAVLRLVNPVFNRVLQSRFHPLFSKYIMLLEVTGRRTGRRYLIPVGRHEDHGVYTVSVSGGWRHNLIDGAPVAVVVDGRARTGLIEVVRDADEVARTFKMLSDRYGPKKASLIGLKINVSRSPTVEEVRSAVSHRWIARIRLE